MQSGFRGYLLTTQESFLQPYYEGLRSVPVLMAEQRSLLSTQHQKKKLDSINILHKAWVEYADSLISAKKDTLPESAARYNRLFNAKLKMEVGKKLNDQINLMFVDMDNYEYDLRIERRSALYKSIKNTRNISLVLAVSSLLIALLASMVIIRIITNRISKMVNLSEKISKGDFITIDDTKKDELTRVIHSLNLMSQTLDKNFRELKQKNNELDQFAYVVSHDLKAPLRGIANIISWIEEDHLHEVTPGVRDNLSLIKGRTTRLENMINGLLEYARIGKIKKGPERVDVKQLLQEIRELIVPDSVEVIIEQNMPVLYTEKLHLEQVFSNLLSNAFKHNTAASPKIIVSCIEKKNHFEFSVSDNGPGIQQEYFEKIFMIFQTLQERDAFESTGVGLAIVKKIIDDNKGTITVQSKLHEGTTFIFTWPKYKSENENEKNNITD
jgi:signal transduction histidine kinase